MIKEFFSICTSKFGYYYYIRTQNLLYLSDISKYIIDNYMNNGVVDTYNCMKDASWISKD